MAVASSRFSVAIHSLMVIANCGDGPVPSDFIAASVGTNPVLIRRLMGDLRQAGLVASKAGPTGGFVLARRVEEITLDRIYAAVAHEALFPRHDHPNMQCPIGRTIGSVLDKIFGGAEIAVCDSLRRLCLSDFVFSARTSAAE